MDSIRHSGRAFVMPEAVAIAEGDQEHGHRRFLL